MAVGEVVGEDEAGRGVARVHRAAAVRELGPWQAAQPSGSDSPISMGVCFSSGYEATVANPASIVRRCVAIPMRTWPSTVVGAPFAWKAMKSSGVPVRAVA